LGIVKGVLRLWKRPSGISKMRRGTFFPGRRILYIPVNGSSSIYNILPRFLMLTSNAFSFIIYRHLEAIVSAEKCIQKISESFRILDAICAENLVYSDTP
jgi:hypothetical protein